VFLFFGETTQNQSLLSKFGYKEKKSALGEF